MNVAFIGYGELGIQLQELSDALNITIQNSIFFDDDKKMQHPDSNNHFYFKEYLDFDFSTYKIIIALGYRHLQLKQTIFSYLKYKKYRFLTIIHPSSFIARTAIIEEGAVIYPMVTIDKDVKIGGGSIINNAAIISHNSQIGSCSYLSPGVICSGKVIIGSEVFIGSGTMVSNQVNIGSRSKIGIGSVITKDLAEGFIGIGNPLKEKKNILLQ